MFILSYQLHRKKIVIFTIFNNKLSLFIITEKKNSSKKNFFEWKKWSFCCSRIALKMYGNRNREKMKNIAVGKKFGSIDDLWGMRRKIRRKTFFNEWNISILRFFLIYLGCQIGFCVLFVVCQFIVMFKVLCEKRVFLIIVMFKISKDLYLVPNSATEFNPVLFSTRFETLLKN
jgi:hypothetical protein